MTCQQRRREVLPQKTLSRVSKVRFAAGKMPATFDRAAGRAAADSRGGSVRIVSAPDEFGAMAAAWNAIAPVRQPLSVFGRHEWFDAAWQWQQLSAGLKLLCYYDGPNLAAVLPLVFRETRLRGMPVRELAFLTVPDTQFCDMIAAERHCVPAAVAFAAELRQGHVEWDVMRLGYLAENSIASTTLRDALVEAGLTTRVASLPGNPFVSLDAGWDTYYATRSRRFKKAINLAANRLKKMGAVQIERVGSNVKDSPDLNRILDCAIGISARSWKQGTGNSLNHAGPQAFIRRLTELAAGSGWLSLWIMRANERALAMEYQLAADGNVYALRSDFDAEFEDVSPGTHLNRCMLEGLFGQGLVRYYMGPGNNPYKQRWAEQVEPMQSLTVYAGTLAGRALAAWETTLKPMVAAVRDRLVKPSGQES